MTDDIFRKRPILGNRILTPIRETKPKYKRMMSLWEAERRCNHYVDKELFPHSTTPCEMVRRNAAGTIYWEVGCNCDLDEKPTPQKVVTKMKEFAFNWT